MKRFFNYLFFRTYYLFKRLYGKNDNPQASAWLFISMILFFSIMGILNFMPIMSKPILEFGNGIIFPILGIILLAIFYFAYIFKGRYIKIVDKYDKDEEPGIMAVLLPLIVFVGVGAMYILSLIY